MNEQPTPLSDLRRGIHHRGRVIACTRHMDIDMEKRQGACDPLPFDGTMLVLALLCACDKPGRADNHLGARIDHAFEASCSTANVPIHGLVAAAADHHLCAVSISDTVRTAAIEGSLAFILEPPRLRKLL